MIKKIVIDKFKSINHLEITPSGNFNVLLGENNIGKTTIFDMIPSSRTQKYKNLLGGILCPEKVKLMQ